MTFTGDRERLEAALGALADAARAARVPRLALEKIDGEPLVGSPLEAMLIDQGFRAGPRKLTLSA